VGIQQQPFQTLSPQPILLVPGTPQRVSIVSKKVRAVIIESAFDNKGRVFIADSEAKASSTNRHTLAAATDTFFITVDLYGNLNAFTDLFNLWFDGTRANDLLVVSFIELTNAIE